MATRTTAVQASTTAGGASGDSSAENGHQYSSTPLRRQGNVRHFIHFSNHLMLACLFLSLQSAFVYGQTCNLCQDGSTPPDMQLIINATTCQQYAQQFQNEADSDRCTAIQATYGVYCGCNNQIDESDVCRVCGQANLLPDPAYVLPPGRNAELRTCLEFEFEANTNPEIVGENPLLTCADVQQFTDAQDCCAASARPTRAPTGSPITTAAPTRAPTPSPTRSPTFFPTNDPTVGPTDIPTAMPTLTPTHVPTESPTLLPTGSPTQLPTSTPTLLPTSIPTTPPTDQPTNGTPTVPSPRPTPVPLVQVGATFDDIVLRLPGIGSMNTTVQDNFESALQGWYASLYELRRVRSRKLQQTTEPLQQFQTRVLYERQSVGDDLNTVTYDQTMSFVQPVTAPTTDLERILLDPFDDPAAVRQLVDRLRVSDAFFADLDEEAIEAPDVPQPRVVVDGEGGGGDDDDDDDSKLGLILGVVAAAVVIVMALVFLILRKPSEKSEESTSRGTNQKRIEEVRDEEQNHDDGQEMVLGEAQNEFSTEPTPVPDSSEGAADDGEEESVPRKKDYDREMTSSPVRAKSPGPGPDEDDTPTVSSARDTRSQRTLATTETGSHMGVLGLEASTNDSVSHYEEPTRQETYEVVAPPGKLGVVIDTPSEGPPTVFAVKETSPLHGKVETGDHLMQVDGEDVSTFSAVKVSKLIGNKAKNPERKFVFSRTMPNLDNDENFIVAHD